MLRAYLSKKLTRPLPTKDGGTLRTVAEAPRLCGGNAVPVSAFPHPLKEGPGPRSG
jgi:hypothetical protein